MFNYKKYNLPTTVSLNPIMVDGTGMCGACRVSIDGKTKFACVDGPEFDGHLVDFDSAMKKTKTIHQQQKTKTIKDHHCTMDLAVSDHLAESVQDKNIEGQEKDGFVIKKAEDRFKRVPISEQAPEERNKNFKEVCWLHCRRSCRRSKQMS